MTLETEVAALTTSVNDLLDAVNVRKATLDASVTLAEDAVDDATAQVVLATAQTALAQGYAASASISAGTATTKAADAAGYAEDAFATTPEGYDQFYRRLMQEHILRTDPPALHLDFKNQTFRKNQVAVAFDDLFTYSGGDGGTRINPVGEEELVVADEPIYDYDPVTRAPKGIALWPERTNLELYSADFTNAAWTTSAVDIDAAASVHPDAFGVVASSDNVGHHFTESITLSANTTYTVTKTFKAGVCSYIYIYLYGTGASGLAFFNVDNGTVGTVAGVTASIRDVGAGWWECSITKTTAATVSGNAIDIGIGQTDNFGVWTGDGTSIGIYIRPGNTEAGAYPTSHIPTTSAAVTRPATHLSIADLSDWFNPSEGTFVVGITTSHLNEANHYDGLIGMRKAGASYPVFALFQWAAGTGGLIYYHQDESNDNQWQITTAAPTPDVPSAASFAYKTNAVAISLNGGTPLTDTSCVVEADQIDIMLIGVNDEHFGGHITHVYYWPRALTDAELQILSTQ